MTYASEVEWANAEMEREQSIRSIRRKRAFWQHVWIYATINFAFWLSWIIGGVRDGWVLPWPLIPTVVWGAYIAYREYRLGGPQAVSHDAIDKELSRLRHPSGPVYYDHVAKAKPIQFGGDTSYQMLPEFHLRDVIDAREQRERQTDEAATT